MAEDEPEGETLDAIGDHNDIRDGVRDANAAETATDEWWAAVGRARVANDDHMGEEEREGLADFRRHAPIGLREALGRQYSEFMATSIRPRVGLTSPTATRRNTSKGDNATRGRHALTTRSASAASRVNDIMRPGVTRPHESIPMGRFRRGRSRSRRPEGNRFRRALHPGLRSDRRSHSRRRERNPGRRDRHRGR